MGEALMPRRGGSIKTGCVDAWGHDGNKSDSIQCDDWIGAKNIILTCVQSIPSYHGTHSVDELDLLVLMVRVQDGVLVEGLSSSVDSEYGYDQHAYTHLWFDSTTGTIGSDTGEWFAYGSLNGEGDNYYYVVY